MQTARGASERARVTLIEGGGIGSEAVRRRPSVRTGSGREPR
jgi:hypothetical protein